MNQALRAAVLATVAFSSTAGAEELRQLRIAVVLDDKALAHAVDEALATASHIYRTQLSIELIEVSRDVANVADHEHAKFLLDELQKYRTKHEPQSTAATVLFTARNLRIGNKQYAGYATMGPACSTFSSAIVRVQFNGLEGTTFSHELAHTLDVPHDAELGWLMSDPLGLNYSETFSPKSVTAIEGVPSDCITPAPVKAPSPAPVPSTPSNGGGGAFGWQLLALLGALIFWRKR